MSDNEFLKEFILDANDHLSDLNEALLIIEKTPENEDAINRIFRAAHTLKGNSATMGFTDISTLAHKMENVLDEVRQGRLKVEEGVVDVLFEALDFLEKMVEAVSQGDSTEDCTPIVNKLQACKSNQRQSKKSPLSEKKAGTKGGSKTFKIEVTLSEKTVLKSVRAFMVLKNMRCLGKILRSVPDTGEIEKGKFENTFTLYLSSDAAIEEIESGLKKVADVEAFNVNEDKPEEKSRVEAPTFKTVQSIRVGTDKLDDLVNLIGELVIIKGRFLQIARRLDQEPLINTVSSFDRLSVDLQNLAMSMRMVKMAHVFDKYPRMIRDLAKKEGKKINFTVEGREIEMDRTVLDKLGEPLVHILRNCVDHGIEPPEERKKKGKAAEGSIKISANRVKDHIEIVIEDDGKGIDPESLKESAIRKGFLSEEEAENLSEDELIYLIFKPGFSGAKKVTDVSGRGVGMDVVKTSVIKLGGSVQVRSEKEKGSVFTLKLPLSLAIIQALLLETDGCVYAIPAKDVVEVLSFEKSMIKKVKGREAIVHRGTPIPVLRLNEVLKYNNQNGSKSSKLVVVDVSKQKIGLAVEQILRQEEIVIKPLSDGLSNIPYFSGATILGDGKVALILDSYNLM